MTTFSFLGELSTIVFYAGFQLVILPFQVLVFGHNTINYTRAWVVKRFWWFYPASPILVNNVPVLYRKRVSGKNRGALSTREALLLRPRRPALETILFPVKTLLRIAFWAIPIAVYQSGFAVDLITARAFPVPPRHVVGSVNFVHHGDDANCVGDHSFRSQSKLPV
jgi:hypothetical protein